jgi:tubulin--tyrosine ligase-like protein 12
MSRENESFPDESFEAAPLPTDRKIKVYSEYVYIGKNLKHPRFEMVDDPEEADVLWLTKHYKKFKWVAA